MILTERFAAPTVLGNIAVLPDGRLLTAYPR